jgi:hypothetical protein
VVTAIRTDGLADAFMAGFYPDGSRWKTPETAFGESKFGRIKKRR